jgi:predicted PurR-regulated permease PerM
VWGPAAIILLVQGRWVAAVFLTAWGMVVIGLVDNLLRPMLISGRTRMHPLAVFFAVVGGIKAFGFLGLFLGPVLVAGVAGVLELYRGVVRGDYGEDLKEQMAPGGELESASDAQDAGG